MMEFKSKRVVVTGGCGSIGSELVKLICDRDPQHVKVLDNDERNLSELASQFSSEKISLETSLANIRDQDALRTEISDVDILFHTAALKHVPLVEKNPYEAVKTNIDGTKNVIEVSIQAGVDSVVSVSTDKAANPSSTMGATKLIAERLVSTYDRRHSPSDTTLSSVRFGNVLGTRGSVVPVFLNQIKEGGPITVTDPDMTRFIMLPSEAAEFVVKSCDSASGGEVFIKKMPAIRIGDLAEAMNERFAPHMSPNRSPVEIRTIGPRPGERYHEKLITEEELRYTEEIDEQFVLYPPVGSTFSPGYNCSLSKEYTSADANLLSKDELSSKIRNEIAVESME
jgi:FlaA1/EpsC-like NDP-sugar epimerase